MSFNSVVTALDQSPEIMEDTPCRDRAEIVRMLDWLSVQMAVQSMMHGLMESMDRAFDRVLREPAPNLWNWSRSPYSRLALADMRGLRMSFPDIVRDVPEPQRRVNGLTLAETVRANAD